MKYLYIITAALCLTLGASAQSNYKPGFYVSLQGDTTRGFVNYREWDENPEAIDFKTTLNNSERRHLTPEDVRLVGINGLDVYKSYIGKVSVDVYSNSGRDTSFEQKSTFLKLLTRGNRIALYDYRDRAKIRYFLSTDDSAAIELILHSYRDNDQNIDERTYRKQLSVIASRSNKLNENLNMLIQRADYKEDDLIKVVDNINDVTDKTAINASLQGLKNTAFFGSVGANVSFYHTDGGLRFAGAPDASSVLPKISAGFNVYVNPRAQRLILRLEVGAALGRYSTAYTSTFSPYNDAIFKFNQINFSISPQVLYNVYSQPKFKFFIGAGMQASLISYSGEEFRNADGSPSTLAVQPFGSFMKSATAFILKTGAVINNKLEINAGYVGVTDVSQDPYYRITNTSIQIGVNYFFK